MILTGGTIDSVGKDRLDLAWYIEAGKRLATGKLLALSLSETKSGHIAVGEKLCQVETFSR